MGLANLESHPTSKRSFHVCQPWYAGGAIATFRAGSQNGASETFHLRLCVHDMGRPYRVRTIAKKPISSTTADGSQVIYGSRRNVKVVPTQV